VGKLDGRVAIITGAGSGIGRAMAKRFVEEGAKVAAVDVNGPAVRATVEQLGEAAGLLIAVEGDITSEADVDRIVESTVQRWARVDVLCNNAGIMDSHLPAAEVSVERWRKVMDVNVTGPFLLSRRVLPGMIANGKGVIINTASIGGLVGGRAGAAYTASKHALVGLTRNIAWAYLNQGIRCVAICPGGVLTGITNDDPEIGGLGQERFTLARATLPRRADPSEIASVAVFLASDDASFVNGQAVVADGGWLAN
jgi:NAD(P)-dependent dehydrogenase (short-subunit alcohol dehydrogenase family)